jgi:hypothetical protein
MGTVEGAVDDQKRRRTQKYVDLHIPELPTATNWKT